MGSFHIDKTNGERELARHFISWLFMKDKKIGIPKEKYIPNVTLAPLPLIYEGVERKCLKTLSTCKLMEDERAGLAA